MIRDGRVVWLVDSNHRHSHNLSDTACDWTAAAAVVRFVTLHATTSRRRSHPSLFATCTFLLGFMSCDHPWNWILSSSPSLPSSRVRPRTHRPFVDRLPNVAALMQNTCFCTKHFDLICVTVPLPFFPPLSQLFLRSRTTLATFAHFVKTNTRSKDRKKNRKQSDCVAIPQRDILCSSSRPPHLSSFFHGLQFVRFVYDIICIFTFIAIGPRWPSTHRWQSLAPTPICRLELDARTATFDVSAVANRSYDRNVFGRSLIGQHAHHRPFDQFWHR